MHAQRYWERLGAVWLVAFCLLAVSTVDAQSKKSAKQAESLETAGENAKASVQEALEGLKKLLAGYNAIIDGEATDTQSAYKVLVNNLKNMQKSIDGTKKQLTALDKEAEKFFKAWDQDLAEISSDSVREKSAKRMEAARSKYASIGETLSAAGAELAPVVRNLNDQVLFLGRDLSPEAVADLQDEAAELNQRAADVTEKVKAMLQSAGKVQHEAEAELEAAEQG
jgi:hypothetical protein